MNEPGSGDDDDDSYMDNHMKKQESSDDYKGVRWLADCVYNNTQTTGVLETSTTLVKTPICNDITQYTMCVRAIRYSELWHPVMATVGIVVAIAFSNHRMHKYKLSGFLLDLDDIERDLSYLHQILPKLTNNIQNAGHMLYMIISIRNETGEEESNLELNHLFDEIDEEVNAARNRLKSAEGSLILLQDKLQSYSKRSLFQNVTLTLGVGIACAVTCYHELVNRHKALIFVGISAVPLFNTLLFLPADINDMMTIVKSRSRMQQRQCRALDNIDKRLMLVKQQ